MKFLILYFVIYGGINYSCFMFLKKAFPGIFYRNISHFWIVLMILSPMIVRFLAAAGCEKTASFLAFAGFEWMFFVFFFLIVDVLLWAFRLVPGFSWKNHIFISLFLVSAIMTYGHFEARNIHVKNIYLTNDKIKGHGVRICLVSDIHFGVNSDLEQIRKIADMIRSAGPDMVVCTGDFFDGRNSGTVSAAHMFRGINAPIGKYAVTGNHEFYAGISESIDFLKQAGFRVLRQEVIAAGEDMLIAGIDDPACGTRICEDGVIREAPEDKFLILLKHRPEIFPYSSRKPDIQLSGHTHSGQIFPFGLVVKLFFPVPFSILYEMGGMLFYNTSGSGAWGANIRFFAPPEIVVFNINVDMMRGS